MGFLNSILPSASVSNTLNRIGANTYESSAKRIADIVDPVERATKFKNMKGAMKHLKDAEPSAILTPKKAAELNKHIGLDHVSHLQDKKLSNLVNNAAENLDDVGSYFSSKSDKINKRRSKYMNKNGESILSQTNTQTFSSSATPLDKAKAMFNKDNMTNYIKGGDLEGGIMGNKGIMAGRYGLMTAAGVGALDIAEGVTGRRTLTTEKGKRNLPVVPFI